MLELGVIEMSKVQPFIKQFRLMDVDGNSRLGRDDLTATEGKSFAELQKSLSKRMSDPKLNRMMSVGDRMGLSVNTPSPQPHHRAPGAGIQALTGAPAAE